MVLISEVDTICILMSSVWVDTICILISNACVHVPYVYYENFFLCLQAGNFLGLLVGYLHLHLTRGKNLFAFRS